MNLIGTGWCKKHGCTAFGVGTGCVECDADRVECLADREIEKQKARREDQWIRDSASVTELLFTDTPEM